MKTFVVVLLLAVLFAFVSAQDNGFDPPSALSRSKTSQEASPVSPAANSPVSSQTSLLPSYSLSPISPNSPAPFSVVTLSNAFSYGSGPFAPFTRVIGSLPNQHIPKVPSLPSFSIPPLSPFSPLFGHVSPHSAAGLLEVSAGVMVACVVAVLAM